jgi:hypothetical protein
VNHWLIQSPYHLTGLTTSDCTFCNKRKCESLINKISISFNRFDSHFLLGRWIAAAKSWATDIPEAFLMEFNARNQITLWGPRGEVLLIA